FHVDRRFLPGLISDSDDVQIFIESLIRLHDHTPPGAPPKSLSHLLVRDRRFSLSMTDYHSSLITNWGKGLDQAIKSIWDGYESGARGNNCWGLLPAPNSSWATTKISRGSAV